MNVTVIIPSYNRYELLKRALNSVYAQTFLPEEVMVVDDGSTDNTLQIQNDFPNVKYIYQINGGVSSARNTGIENASFEWMAFLDSDDEWLDDKLEKQVKFHKKNTNILMSYTDEIWIRDEVLVKISKKFRKIGSDVFLENLSFCNIAPSSVLIHKTILDDIGLFDEELEVCEDYDLWLRIAQSHKVGLVNEKLIKKYAGHSEQLSFKHWGMDRFRVLSLEKLMSSANDAKKLLIKEELIKKYTLLLTGAVKYDKLADIELYTQKIRQLTKVDY